MKHRPPVLAWLAAHPFSAGLLLTLLTAFGLSAGSAAEFSTATVRGLGLMVYGGALFLLMRNGMGREALLSFFLGAVIGLLGAFALGV